MINFKNNLSNSQCQKLSNPVLKKMCVAKGISGYSQLKKSDLVSRCCTAENRTIEERLGWEEDTRFGDEIYRSNDGSALSSTIDAFNASENTRNITKVLGVDYVNIQEIPDPDYRIFFIENAVSGNRMINSHLHFRSQFDDFLVRSPIEGCGDDFYDAEYVETALESLENPEINESGRCEWPLIIKGTRHIVAIAPTVVRDDDTIYTISKPVYHDFNKLSKRDLQDMQSDAARELGLVDQTVHLLEEKDVHIRQAYILGQKFKEKFGFIP